jgi:hypothetical protein
VSLQHEERARESKPTRSQHDAQQFHSHYPAAFPTVHLGGHMNCASPAICASPAMGIESNARAIFILRHIALEYKVMSTPV